MNRLLLKDLLGFTDEELSSVKIKFNQWNGNADPLTEWLKDPEIINTGWLFWRGNNNYFFSGQIAICLVKMTHDTWLLTTIKKVGKELGVYNGVNFEGEEITKYKSLFGRVVIKYHKTGVAQGRYISGLIDELVVSQILPDIYDGNEFPGYDNVCLSYEQLALVVMKSKRDWIAALANQKAVYLITDKNTGKLYVGSATAKYGMLLQRWSDYVSNGHGGNKEFKLLVEREGMDYVKKYFQYTILENYNFKIDDEFILYRESWWKKVLRSREWGYNSN